jgi:hypothetical protein
MSGNNLSIQVNATNDIFIDNTGRLAMGSGILSLQQSCEHRMKAQFGEMFLQPTDGQLMFADVWSQKNFAKFAAQARATLTAMSGVIRVVSFTMSTLGDVFSYIAVILTTYSPTLLTISASLDIPT